MREKIKEFLEKLSIMYPIEGNNERKIGLLDMYTETLVEEILRTGKKYDLNRLFKYIQKRYQYKNFPSIPYLLSILEKAEVFEESLSGNEGKEIIKVINGYPYKFQVVPNTRNCKTEEEIDREINRRKFNKN